MYKQLSQAGRFSEKRSARYLKSLARALSYCHERDVIHRDVKPENLLIGVEGEIKLADFGWAIRSDVPIRSPLCGTLDYLAPEMVSGSEHGPGVDIWALGVVAFEFMAGFPPFEAKSFEDTYHSILSGHVSYPSHFSAGVKDFVGRILRQAPQERLSLAEILQHDWIVANSDNAAEVRNNLLDSTVNLESLRA